MNTLLFGEMIGLMVLYHRIVQSGRIKRVIGILGLVICCLTACGKFFCPTILYFLDGFFYLYSMAIIVLLCPRKKKGGQLNRAVGVSTFDISLGSSK